MAVKIEGRRIFLFGEIDEKACRKVAFSIARLGDSDKPIELMINSDGGEIYHALGLYDIIRQSRSPIITIGVGQVMSSAVLILASGDTRYIGKNCYLMVHDIFLEGLPDTKVSALRKDLNHLVDLRQRFFKLLAKHSKLELKEWETRSGDNADCFFDSMTAIKYGIADKLWPEK